MKWYLWTREQRITVLTLLLAWIMLPFLMGLAWLIWIFAFHFVGEGHLRIEKLAAIGTSIALLFGMALLTLAMVLSIRAFKGSIGKDGLTFDATGQGDGGASETGDKLKVAAAVTDAVGDALKGAS